MGEPFQLTQPTAEPAAAACTDPATTPEAAASSGRGTVLWPALTALLVCLFWTLAESTRVGVPAPFEDAAMLFKYAENTAHGWGIVWNPGEAPGATDGATDLGFVGVLAALNAVGVPTVLAALLVNLAAVTGIGALFGALNAAVWKRSTWLPVAVAAAVAGGPANRYVLSGFSPPVLGFLLLSAFTLAAVASRPRVTRHSSTLFAAAGLVAAVAGWWRPEGFAFGPLAVLFGILLASRSGSARVLRSVAVWAVLLVPYVVLLAGWAGLRVSYFGQLLPTSAVMKSGSFQGENAAFSLQFYGSLLLPVIGLLVVGMLGRQSPRSWRLALLTLAASLLWVNSALPPDFWQKVGLPVAPTISVLATVVVFVPLMVALGVVGTRKRDGSWLFPVALIVCSLAWVGMATTLNWWGRMQWPLLPVLAAIAVHFAAAANVLAPASSDRTPTRGMRRVFVALLVCVGIAPFHLPAGGYFESPFQSSVSDALRAVDTSTVRIATTEAGLIPLAVTGSALDTYGHNNRDIARSHGRLLAAELVAFQPNIIAVHGLPPTGQRVDGCTPDRLAAQTTFTDRWSQMVTDIYTYADRNAVRLTRISETKPCETWSLWLSSAVSPAVRAAIDDLAMPGTEVAVDSPRSTG